MNQVINELLREATILSLLQEKQKTWKQVAASTPSLPHPSAAGGEVKFTTALSYGKTGTKDQKNAYQMALDYITSGINSGEIDRKTVPSQEVDKADVPSKVAQPRTAQSTQPAVRGVIEEFHKNCGFILTCNYKNRIIPALHSRCKPIEFVVPKSQKPQLAKEFFVRLKGILDEEGIKFEPKAVAEVINKYFPDWRRVLSEIQMYSHSGTIDAGILLDLERKNIKELIPILKNKELTNVRKWIVDNIDNDSDSLFRNIYDIMFDAVELNTIPYLVVLLGEYQYKSNHVADQEINMFAFLVEVMSQVKFK